MRAWVLLSTRQPRGVEEPHPLWSTSTTFQCCRSKNRLQAERVNFKNCWANVLVFACLAQLHTFALTVKLRSPVMCMKIIARPSMEVCRCKPGHTYAGRPCSLIRKCLKVMAIEMMRSRSQHRAYCFRIGIQVSNHMSVSMIFCCTICCIDCTKKGELLHDKETLCSKRCAYA